YQMAAAMLLVLMMGFAVIGIQQGANRAGPGFDTSSMYLFSVDPVRDGYSPTDSGATLAGLPQRLARVSGVEGVTLADSSAFTYMPPTLSAVSVGPAEPENPKSIYRVSLQKVGPGFFAALGMHVMRGAEFDFRDLRSEPDSGARLPVVINQSAAQKLFEDNDPMGRVIREGERIFQVAGVVRYEKSAVFQRDPVPAVFLPLTMQDLQRGRMVVVRVRKGVGFAAIRGEMKAIDSRLTLVNVQSMDEYLSQFSHALEYVTTIYGTVGMFALILACVGLAGVTAQAVVRRRREIGIRMALGARRPEVLRLVMKEAAAMVLVGSVLGIAGAAALVRVVLWASASIGPINPGALEPAQVVGPPLLLIAVAAVACYLPARRSATIDPVAALRDE
ncbi:MAG: FtsX-like permease family protein, partial [Bryobacteraceae bacterium]